MTGSSPFFEGDGFVVKALLWIVAIIFIIGLLVVFGLLDLVF